MQNYHSFCVNIYEEHLVSNEDVLAGYILLHRCYCPTLASPLQSHINYPFFERLKRFSIRILLILYLEIFKYVLTYVCMYVGRSINSTHSNTNIQGRTLSCKSLRTCANMHVRNHNFFLISKYFFKLVILYIFIQNFLCKTNQKLHSRYIYFKNINCKVYNNVKNILN